MRVKTREELFFGIQKKAILCITAINAIAFLAIFFCISYIIRIDRYDSLATQYSYINDKILLSFGHVYNEINQMASDFIRNEYVQKTLLPEEMSKEDISMLKKTLSYREKSYLDAYLVMDNKGNLYSSQELSMQTEQLKDCAIYNGLGEEDSKTKLIWARDVIMQSYGMNLFAVRSLNSLEDNIEPGMVILKINAQVFDGIKEIIKDPDLVCLIVDPSGEVCYEHIPQGFAWDSTVRKQILKMSMAEGKEFRNYDNGIVIGAHEEETGFTIMMYAPKEITEKVIKNVMNAMLVIFFIVYIITCMFLIWYTKKLTTPIALLSDTMTKLDDTTLDKMVHFHTNTELDSIGEAYNGMLIKVKSLMDDVKNKEAELRESEMNVLLYQIRPHFLYNTLDNIYMLARIQKEETIMKMIQALSKLLRITLSNGKMEISVEEELEYVSSYLEIQKIRNADLFDYQITLSKEAKDYKVIKMLLQPVTENCIKYGFSEIYEGGKIVITADVANHYLVFQIKNNGSLISDENIRKLNCMEQVSMEQMDDLILKKAGGFGMINVVKRLRLRYNDRIRFYYEREEAETVCTIKIDCRMLNRCQ